jgi:hypothetical protein
MDTEEGDEEEPLSLHRYLYASASPVNRIDPSGHDDLAEVSEATGVMGELQAQSLPNLFRAYTGISSTLDAVKLALAVSAVTYGLLNPERDFAGVVYDLSLNAVTGGDYPDVKIGVERRWNGDGGKATVFRLAVGATRLRFKISDTGIGSISGGLNFPLWNKKGPLGTTFKMDLGTRVSTNFGSNPAPALYAFFEFSLSFGMGIPNDINSITGLGESIQGKPAAGLGVSARTKALVIPLTPVFNGGADLLSQISVADAD